MTKIEISGTPRTPGSWEVSVSGSDAGLLIDVLSSTSMIGTLTRYDKDGTAITLELPNIQSIEENDTSTITEISTIIYGYEDNFVMDIGTTQRYTVSFTRVNPTEVTDDLDFAHQHLWSNGHWFRMFKLLTDRWQNLQYDENGRQTGGFRFYFSPGEDDVDLYPTLDRNVFIAGGVSATFSNNLQTMKISLPLAVGTMIRNTQLPSTGVPITYVPNILAVREWAAFYPPHIDIPLPYPPTDWLDQVGLYTFKQWVTPLGNRPAGAMYPVSNDSVNRIVADWQSPTAAKRYDNDIIVYFTSGDVPADAEAGTYEVLTDEFPSAVNVKSIKIYAIGGGGGGARAYSRTVGSQESHEIVYNAGGGGGSGGYLIRNAYLGNDISGIQITIGQGGGSGVDGGASNVSLYDGNTLGSICYAGGGKGAPLKFDPISGASGGSGEGGAGGSPNGSPGGSISSSDKLIPGEGGRLSQLSGGMSLVWSGGTITIADTVGAGGAGGDGSSLVPQFGQAGCVVIAYYTGGFE